MRNHLEKGLIQVYTGNSKGKSTAAFGLALRAVGNALNVFIIQFMKGSDYYGELNSFKRLEPECRLEHYGLPGWVKKGEARAEDVAEAHKALARAEELMLSGEWDIIILDEVNNALWFELLTVEEVLTFLNKKPDNVELVLTGRNAPEEIISVAHLVTEMVERKHPYQLGINARKGIEF
jgi:cob(I)alamin adenosyltransferase